MAMLRLARHIVLPLALLLTWGGVLAQRAVPLTRSHHPDIPYQSPTTLGAASYAKILCSAVFVSGREVDEARQNSAYILMNASDREKPIAVDVDRQATRVHVTLDKVTRTAAFYGDQGCVIHPIDHDGIHFTPVPVPTMLPDANAQPWPMGDAPSRDAWPAQLDRARMQAAVDLAFADPAGLTAGMVVVYKGQIVGERYMPGITKDTQLESWSMGKSLIATLVGLVIKDGALSLDDPAPIAEWRRPGDPRAPIRVRDIMRMSQRAQLHRPGRSLDGPDVAIPRSLLHLRGRGRRVQVLDLLTRRVCTEYRGPLSQLGSDDAGVPRAAGRQETRRTVPDLPAARALRQDRHPQTGARDRSVGQFPVERLRLRHGRATGRVSACYTSATGCGTASGCCPKASPSSSARPRRRGGDRSTAVSSGSTATGNGTFPPTPTSWRARAASTRSSCRHTIWLSCGWATNAALPWA